MLSARTSSAVVRQRSSTAGVTLLFPARTRVPGQCSLPAQKQADRQHSHLGVQPSRTPVSSRLTAVQAVPAEAMVHLAFTPQHGALGGAFIATAVIANLLLTGRVLGISGIVKGILNGDTALWRPAFVLGLVGAVPTLVTLFPAAFPALPASYSIGRALLGGLLVGVGTSIGNGCTSGHGVCGNARFSLRSFVFTLVFMATGMLSANVLHTADAALNIAATNPAFTALSTAERGLGLSLLAGFALCLGLLGLTSASVTKSLPAAKDKTGPSITDLLQALVSLVVGTTFSTGLALSGMTNAGKVAGFLSVSKPYWDASLMFVMATAVLAAAPFFQFVMRRIQKQPTCAPVLASAYSLPANSTLIDAKLLGGGALFGLGWGLTGMCPGPAILLAASPAAGTQVWAYIAAMLLGMSSEGLLKRLQAASSPAAPPAVPVAPQPPAQLDLEPAPDGIPAASSVSNLKIN